MLPKPMTPENAKRVARRFRWTCAAAWMAAILCVVFDLPTWAVMVLLAGAVLCSAEAASCYGWTQGYLARERAYLREDQS